tara:strand:- start:61 stop:435 length:375 start_codon:yes stop_codon:yes gene_type:complete
MTIKITNTRIFFRYLVTFVIALALLCDASKQVAADEQTIISYINSGNKKSTKGDYKGAISELTKAIEMNSIYPVLQGLAYELRALNRLALRGISDKKGICFDLRQASSLGIQSATTTFYELCDH